LEFPCRRFDNERVQLKGRPNSMFEEKEKGREPGGQGPRVEPPGEEALFNEAQILHLLKVEFARARRYRQPLSCALLSIDRLDEKADLFGTRIRGALVREVMLFLRKAVRISDFLGLYERDGILLLLPHTDLEGCRVLAERLREEVKKQEFSVQGHSFPVTLSIGIASSSGKDLLFHDALLKNAERAWYFSQERGGDWVAAWEGGPGEAPEG